MIVGKTIKYTKNNKAMAFLTVEDLFGTVEIIVFPKDYEKYHYLMSEDAKVFVRGRVSVEEDKNGKLICERIYPFDAAKRELWLQFATKEEYEANENEIMDILKGSDGNDMVVIYISSLRAMKRLGENMSVFANNELINELNRKLGENNVKVLEKSIEKISKRD